MISLDIGTKYIKLCKLEKKSEEFYEISTMIKASPGSLDTPAGSKQLGKVLRSIFSDKRFKTKDVIASLGSPELLIRNLELPVMPREELQSTIKLQGERLIYSDLNDMDIDFCTLPSKKNNKMDVIFVAAPSAIVCRHMEMIQSGGIQPVIMDIDNLALANCFLEFGGEFRKKTVVLINIGHSKSCFTILNHGKFCFSKSIKFGGINIISEIMRELETSMEKAEMIFQNPEKWAEFGVNIKSVLRKSSPDLLELIYKSVAYCKSQNMISEVDLMLLTGGVAYTPQIDSFFAEILGIETLCWNPMDGIKLLKDKSHGMFQSVAMGLGLRVLKDV